ncbi:alpha-ketoglutarate permease [Niabella ginsenosidivorans]|uniref:Alpha-ketoglutarate permease n=1 Tax=Niabella ginsenosidivorans TaxID=1176587 RepID=A0A1A9I7P1_9BACT|nr:MFS transporter [Niabella ginsenosidivorans]ANH83697.1 alpha-ketoglutarate permease [Niabella ginsenosidivorans]
MNNHLNSVGFFAKTGLPKNLAWGYLGILIFMMGDGVEQGWLSPYLIHDRGLTIEQSATLFSVYGLTVAISSFLSGILAEGLGVRKAMWTGFFLFMAGTFGFVGLGLKELDFNVMLLTYAIRGFGYPLFAYTFLVWITYRIPQTKLGTAVGWFWFVFTGGLNVFGAYYSSWAIGRLGHINTLWTSLFWVSLGTLFALLINRDRIERTRSKDKLRELADSIKIAVNEPKVFLGGIVRTINTTAQFAFPVFMPIYFEKYGFSTSDWLKIWGTIFTANIVFNLIFGFVGDRLGWRRTISLFGGIGCGITTLLFYYSPRLSNGNFYIVLISGVLWGALLAGYVPLSALVPSLVSKGKGAAMAFLNLGAGLSVFAGPLIVRLFIGPAGNAGVIWILAILYFLSALLTRFITLPKTTGSEPGQELKTATI